MYQLQAWSSIKSMVHQTYLAITGVMGYDPYWLPLLALYFILLHRHESFTRNYTNCITFRWNNKSGTGVVHSPFPYWCRHGCHFLLFHSCFYKKSLKMKIGRYLLIQIFLELLSMNSLIIKLESCVLLKASVVKCISKSWIELQSINSQSMQDKHSINIPINTWSRVGW